MSGRGRHGRHAKASAHGRWQRDRIVGSNGYVKVRVGREHPLADPQGYAYEHLVVWVAAGRPRPGPGQTLHHRNEDKQDNRIGNLEMIDRGQHARLHARVQRRDRLGRFARPPRRAGR